MNRPLVSHSNSCDKRVALYESSPCCNAEHFRRGGKFTWVLAVHLSVQRKLLVGFLSAQSSLSCSRSSYVEGTCEPFCIRRVPLNTQPLRCTRSPVLGVCPSLWLSSIPWSAHITAASPTLPWTHVWVVCSG